jgi:V/A-type H+/Na+-transporting ATPase subunit B
VRLPVEQEGVAAIHGPVLVIEGVTGVGWDEVCEIRMPSGERRRGIVLDVHEDLAVVEVLEGTSGLTLERLRVAFSGAPLAVPVGAGWLGRVWNGRGQPLDGGPPIAGHDQRPIVGTPINPARRDVPRDPIITGVSAIDGLATLVRGQKLPIFSVAGLPHLELAAQVAVQARAGADPFAVVFAAVGITHTDAAIVRGVLEERSQLGDLALFVNTADDPSVERLATPRIALTVAEHLAFDEGRHVLVVIADLTSYCEALREVSAARGEMPGRRGFPGYLYSDLASLLERAGRIRGRPGSLTQLPVLTMPAGDITHPVADLTGYITEGQLVLSQALDRRGIYPPFDALSSLSRLMRLGAGAGRTRDDHLAVAAQIYAAVAKARRIEDLAEIVGADVLSVDEARYLGLAAAFERRLLAQSQVEDRTIDDTLARIWQVLSLLPRRDLTMLPETLLDRYHTATETG